MGRTVHTINTNEKIKCLISYAKNGREPYEKALERNKREAKNYFKGDFIYLSNQLPEMCDEHSITPYQFKPFLFNQAYQQEYRKILWMDSTIIMLRDPEPIFDVMEKQGVVAFHNIGHPLVKWISDTAIRTTGVDMDEHPEQIMACVVGFDLNHPKGKEIFDEWFRLSQDGKSFQNNPSDNPRFIAHRHDQAILSALLHIHKIPLLPYGNLIYEAHEDGGYEGKTAYFLNKGIK